MALFETVGGKQIRRAFEKHDSGKSLYYKIAYVHVDIGN